MKTVHADKETQFARLIRVPACIVSASLMLFFHTGCAIRHYDARTGTEHVWGFSHVKMRVASAPGARPAVATQTDIAGLGLSAGRDDYGLTLGWASRSRLHLPENAAFSASWPTRSLFDVRVGSAAPDEFAAPPPALPKAEPAAISKP